MKALIVGASRGIGFEFVRQYRAEGATVTATARDEAGLARLRDIGAAVLRLDVTDAASAAGLAWPIGSAGFDVAIVNAGVYGPRTNGLEPPSAEDFDAVMHTNVLGAMRVLPQIAEALARIFHQGRRFAAVLSVRSSVIWPIHFAFGKTAQHAPHPFGGRLASQAFAPMVSTMGLAPCEPIHPAKRRGARCLGEISGLAPGAKLAVISSRMGSIGLRTAPGGWLYRASKAALNSVLKDTSLALQGRAVCVAFHPGWVRTDMGGTGADLDVTDAVSDMRRTMAALKPADNGRFFNHDGAALDW